MPNDDNSPISAQEAKRLFADWRGVPAIVLRTWRHQPDVVRVLVREIARSPEMQERISDLVKPIQAIRHIIERGQASGEFRADLDPALAAVVFFVLTGEEYFSARTPVEALTQAIAERRRSILDRRIVLRRIVENTFQA